MHRSIALFDRGQRRAAFAAQLIAAFVFVLLSYAYFSVALSISANKNLWMDEALAVSTARLSSWGEIWLAIWKGAEFSPPTYHFFLHELLTHCGSCSDTITTRVPSIVALYIAALCIFALVRAQTNSIIALVALGFTLDSGLFIYAIQARQYALLASGLAIALLLWNGMHERGALQLRALALWFVLAFCLSLHFYGFIEVTTIGVAETIWLVTRKDLRWSVWFPLAGTAPVAATWYPLGKHLKEFVLQDSSSGSYYGHPSVGTLLEAIFQSLVSEESVALLTLCALVLAGAAYLADRGGRPSASASEPDSRDHAKMTKLEIIAAALLTIPFVSFGFSVIFSSSFAVRYASAASLFPGVFYGCVMGRVPFNKLVSLTMAPVIAASLLARKEEFNSGLVAPVRSVLAATVEAPLPIVVGEGLLFVELMEGLDANSRSQLNFLLAPADTVGVDPTYENQVRRLATIHPEYRVREQNEFLSEAECFYVLYRPWGPSDATTPSLMRQRLLREPLKEEGGILLFRAGRNCP